MKDDKNFTRGPVLNSIWHKLLILASYGAVVFGFSAAILSFLCSEELGQHPSVDPAQTLEDPDRRSPSRGLAAASAMRFDIEAAGEMFDGNSTSEAQSPEGHSAGGRQLVGRMIYCEFTRQPFQLVGD